ncbi:sce7725 family protein [Companilactobacillus huachuanensis]|uniref:Sce7725 family protein n=1 Tax=Companilactobacillus huachuanensis TaxID=2559914 RepID=A0ABW1RMN8_9LACO|nr:sce7725 family protein [Companilactobacillus huachuanensis]
MYFPIFRSKQNELLALRELSDNGLLSNNIVPIIEPITPSPTLKKLLIQFDENNKKIAVIQNPSIVQYDEFDDNEIKNLKKKSNFIPALIVDRNNDFDFSRYNNSNKMVILGEKSEFDESNLVDSETYAVVEVSNRSVIRSLDGCTKMIELHDQFVKQDRNVDYLNKIDELFSTEQRYFKKEGFYGFSDYSVVGGNYQSSGFAAKAVAIHLVYFDVKNDLRIHHFVSDSNDDIKNPALKAHEALKKLVDFVYSETFDIEKNHSKALDEFRRLYSLDKYSGLGYIKKLSIEHHLEIMGRFLDK